MAAIGGILTGIGVIASLIIWIMTIIKCFKANDTLWGVLSIFIGICGLIWLFMNGHKKLGLYWIGAIVLTLIGYGILIPAMIGDLELEPVPAN